MATATATRNENETADKPAEKPKPKIDKARKPPMPYVTPGMIVWWYRDGDRCNRPHAAMVSEVAFDRISVGVLASGYANYETHDGVRHIDEKARNEADNEEGAWEHMSFTKKLMELTDTDWTYDAATNSWS